MLDERRRWPRVEVEVHVVMRFARTEDVLKTRSLNISRRGVFLATGQVKPIGTPVRLSLDLDEEGEHLEVGGVVIREVREPEADRPRGVGVFLTEVPPTWDAFCERLEKARASHGTAA